MVLFAFEHVNLNSALLSWMSKNIVQPSEHCEPFVRCPRYVITLGVFMASPVRSANWLLEKLPAAYLEQLKPHLTRVPLSRDQVLCEPNVPFNYAYFPLRGALSA